MKIKSKTVYTPSMRDTMDSFDILDLLRRERHLIPTVLIVISNILDEEPKPFSRGDGKRARRANPMRLLSSRPFEEEPLKEPPVSQAE